MNLKSDQLAYALIGVIAFLVFANTLGHGFVYDDNRQILMNSLIQRSDLYGRALTSDVWAFKGGEGIAASNYFRPTFVAWLIANWALFGASPFGWHLISVLQHVAVCLLLFALLRRFDCDRLTATVIAALFAVHPVHVESVAWISGATDALVAFFLFGSLILADFAAKETARKSRRFAFMVLSVTAFLFAAGAKEVALFCLPLYWLIFRNADRSSLIAPTISTIPFGLVGVAFFIVRVRVLGAFFLPVEDPVAKGSVLITIPKLFVFYLQQAFFPLWLGPSLPIRPVETFDLAQVVVPVIITLAVCAALVFLARRSFIRCFGLALFALTILPVLNLSNFGNEQIAHDRYLYLPIAGLLIVLVPELSNLIGDVAALTKQRIATAVIGGFLIVLAIKTVTYNPVWKTNERLWRHAVTVDPGSAHAWFYLAAATPNQREALDAYERSLEIRPNATAMAGKARALIGLGNYDAAVVTAGEAIAMDPRSINAYTLFQAYEAETYALAALGRYSDAETSLRNARERLPIYRAALTEKIAVMLYSQNRKSEALTELEGARLQAQREMLPASKLVIFRLGMLYSELGRRDDSKAAFLEYLAATENDPGSSAERQQAVQMLRSLR